MSNGGSIAGRFATFSAHVLATASSPILGPAATLLAGPIVDLAKGLAGDHVPGISRQLMQRLRGLDPSKLNHDIQKALLSALQSTMQSLIFVYEHPPGSTRKLAKKDRAFLETLFTQLAEEIKKEARTSSSLITTEQMLGGSAGPSSSILLQRCRALQAALGRKVKELERIVIDEFDRHFQLHFSEYLKDSKNSKALVAYEQLTARELLAEVRGLKSSLASNTVPAGDKETGAMSDADRARLEANIETWTAHFGDPETLAKALAPAIEANLDQVTERLGEIKSMLEAIGDRTISIEHEVGATRTTAGLNTKLAFAILAMIIALAVFFVLDPLHLRSFRLKVEVDTAHDYGAKDRMVRRIAIAYADVVHDTAVVKEGFASFRIPDEFRNDNASLRLLCQTPGQSIKESVVCDSQMVRLTDLDRVLFPRTPSAATGDMVKPGEGAKRKQSAPSGVTGENGSTTARSGNALPPCGSDGLDFISDGSLEDRLSLSASGGGRVLISGEVNRKPVDGTLRVNGTRLTAVSGMGTLQGGSLSLVGECRQLKGQLILKSPSGVQVSVTVNMLNNAR